MLKPILRETNQEIIDVSKVLLLITRDLGGTNNLNLIFTDYGKGYINQLADHNPDLAVVREIDYIKLKKEKEELETRLEKETNKVEYLEKEIHKQQNNINELLFKNEDLQVENLKLKTSLKNKTKKTFF